MAQTTIPVTFDKSHIITIGEKLYGESLELLRELVANAYDADATQVEIEATEHLLVVRDDGSGMDEEGLREFFRIGSQNKMSDPLSPQYKRQRIGQFGIGKFAVLTACRRFRVHTQKQGYGAEVTFDKRTWEGNDTWHVPLHERAYDPVRGEGTTVILEDLTRIFTLPDIERFIRERLPLAAPHFSIYVNGKRVESTHTPGRKFPVDLLTPFGPIRGEIILANVPGRTLRDVGVECVVRGVVIQRSTFGMDLPIVPRLRGRVEADFLPITSDRSRFITDTDEYRAFESAMNRILRQVNRAARDLSERRERQRADEALKDTLIRMRRAIRRNPDIAPRATGLSSALDEEGMLGNGSEEAGQGLIRDGTENISKQTSAEGASETAKQSDSGSDAAEPPARKIRVQNLRGRTVTARRITVGGIGITCALEPCGEDLPPAFTESGIVYVNTDHPLYARQKKRGREMLSYHLTVLLSQQVSLMLAADDARRALSIQQRLLCDSW